MSDHATNELLSPIYNVLLRLEPKLRGYRYEFMSLEEYGKIRAVDELQYIYWGEIVQRMHICAVTSLRRIRKWLDVVEITYKADNYYGFCASLRGLVEACGDTYFAVSRVLEPACEHFAAIEIAVRGEASSMLVSHEIEDILIHYIHARKLSKSEKASYSPQHEAEQVRTYIGCLEHDDIVDLYAELCQVTHPSVASFMPFMLSTDEHPLFIHDTPVDTILNNDLLDRHKSGIVVACKLAVVPSMCILKVINEIDAPYTEALRTDEDVLRDAIESEFWKDLAAKMSSSRKRYKDSETR
jgi:hypothetical protein